MSPEEEKVLKVLLALDGLRPYEGGGCPCSTSAHGRHSRESSGRYINYDDYGYFIPCKKHDQLYLGGWEEIRFEGGEIKNERC